MFTCEIISNQKVTPGAHILYLKKPDDYRHTPGQYTQVSLPGYTYFTNLAIASHPDENNLELLISAVGVNAVKLCRLPPGALVNIASPIGSGFPMEKLTGKTVYLITHGSGISAIKPVIQEIRKNRNKFGPVRLLYGVRTPEDFPYPRLLRDWMGSLEIYDIISKNPAEVKIWSGETGYVQDILLKIQPDPENAIAAICGNQTMESQVRDILKNFGFSDSQILQNH